MVGQNSMYRQEINEFLYLCESDIHSKGVFSQKNIPSGTRLLQYKGELISKEEGTRRAELTEQLSKNDPSKGATYIIEVDDEQDIDGNAEDNYAKYINHSCEPNCKFQFGHKEVWVVAIKDIPAEEELSLDYEFDFDPADFFDHPCKCGSKNCVGYIVHKDQRNLLEHHLQKNKHTTE